jgi:PAS domain S-box-containing protein
MGIDTDKRQAVTAAELRRQAEDQLRLKADDGQPPATDEAMQRLVHELEVHQIEMEMQNAELRQSRDEVERALENYTDLYDFAPVGYFSLDRRGAICAVNLTGATLLGTERSRLIGQRFMKYITEKDRPAFTDFIGLVFSSTGKESCEIELLTKENLPLIMLIEAVATSSGQECRLALIDISILKQIGEELKCTQVKLEAKNAGLEQFNRIFVGRELRMVELKDRIKVLERRGGPKVDQSSEADE